MVGWRKARERFGGAKVVIGASFERDEDIACGEERRDAEMEEGEGVWMVGG
jgi:hypothetical protein